MAYPLTGTARTSAGVTLAKMPQVKLPGARSWSPPPTYQRNVLVNQWPAVDAWPLSGQGWPRIKQR